MLFSQLKNQFSKQEVLVKTLMGVCFISLLLNIVLAGLATWGMLHQRTYIVPASLNQTIMVSDSQVDASYLQQMALEFVYLRFNVGPQNVEYQNQFLKAFIDQRVAGKLTDVLTKEMDAVKSQNISSSFLVITPIKVDTKHLQVEVSGYLSQQVGNSNIPPVLKTYLLTFSYQFGRLAITSFNEEPKS